MSAPRRWARLGTRFGTRFALRSWLVVACCAAAGLAPAASPPERHRGEVEIDLAFTPRHDAQKLILDTLSRARNSVRVQAYLLTNRSITRALISAHRRGVQVEVLADRDRVYDRRAGSRIPELHAAGVPVWLEVDFGHAHNKVMVIDAGRPDCAVVTGSFNFTTAAQRSNAENVLVLRRHAGLCAAYAENWRRHRIRAIPYGP